jgi:hypothetical protein
VNLIVCLDNRRYFVVAGGDDMARFTCLDMLFCSFLDFGTGWIITAIYIVAEDILHYFVSGILGVLCPCCRVPLLTSFFAASLIPCGYLVARVVSVVVARPISLVIVSV